MCRYEMDPASIAEDTERTRFGLQMEGQTKRETDGYSIQYTRISISLVGV